MFARNFDLPPVPSPIIYEHIFFFSCHGHPQDLHSFPTHALPISTRASSKRRALPRPLGWFWARLKVACSRPVRLERSEEHTSELQSRPHLVCRLLLEKKNTTYS